MLLVRLFCSSGIFEQSRELLCVSVCVSYLGLLVQLAWMLSVVVQNFTEAHSNNNNKKKKDEKPHLTHLLMCRPSESHNRIVYCVLQSNTSDSFFPTSGAYGSHFIYYLFCFGWFSMNEIHSESVRDSHTLSPKLFRTRNFSQLSMVKRCSGPWTSPPAHHRATCKDRQPFTHTQSQLRAVDRTD